MVRLAIDFENSSEEWWDNGGRALWESLLEGFDNSDVILSEDIAESVIREAAKIPGWEGGPDYAPHPLRTKEVNEDEEL